VFKPILIGDRTRPKLDYGQYIQFLTSIFFCGMNHGLGMGPQPFLGVFLHALGGFAAGSFYIPYKRVRGWAWESYWLVGGFFSWIIAPLTAALLTCPDLFGVLKNAPATSLFLSYLFGVLWGIGGLTFGLTMRYLGLSLGYALALGFCAAFGTIIPPLATGAASDLIGKISGQVTFFGIIVCLAGIAVCSQAGSRKEAELSTEEKRAVIKEFNFATGLWVAVFSGVMSACMALAYWKGAPIAETAVKFGTPPLFKNFPVLVVALWGGFTTNLVWCLILNIKNRSWRDYFRSGKTPLAANYVFSALAGITWYFQFFFYSMGTTKMGKYDFSSWTIHMAFIIVFSNLWGLAFQEWKGTGRRTRRLVIAGIIVLVVSTLIVGAGNYIASLKK